MKRCAVLLATIVLLVTASPAKKKTPPQPMVIEWPQNNPVLRFTFTAVEQTGGYANQKAYSTEVTIQNLWTKTIDGAVFRVFLTDAGGVRVGESSLHTSKLSSGETARMSLIITALGEPKTLRVEPLSVPDELGPPKPPHKITTTVYSVPPGAILKVNGKLTGNTPLLVEFGDGQHVLELSKEGFNPGTYTFNVGPNDASGGNITVELGGLNHDTIELRDGSILIGDVQSLSATEVIVTVGGQDQRVERNQVKKLLLIQREGPILRAEPRGSVPPKPEQRPPARR